jgi:hypothetical protein
MSAWRSDIISYYLFSTWLLWTLDNNLPFIEMELTLRTGLIWFITHCVLLDVKENWNLIEIIHISNRLFTVNYLNNKSTGPFWLPLK